MRLKTSLRFAVMVSLVAMPAGATPVIGVTGAGSASVVYEGDVTFPDFAGFVGPATIIDKDHISTTLILDVAYDSADFDVIDGFRWGERITNSSATPWTDYHVDVEGGFFFSKRAPQARYPNLRLSLHRLFQP